MPDNTLKMNVYDNNFQEIKINNELIKKYKLKNWSKDLTLMTAGYRDRLDPENILSSKVSFNLITLAILAEAKARVFKRKTKMQLHVHVGGETRPHTQEFIMLLSRIYAANKYIVHLRKDLKTTPIWYSSFGIFYNKMESGDNLTASHSQYFKGGWKPLDAWGKQIVNEEQEIIKEVKKIITDKATIKLAPANSEKIIKDFDVDREYIKYLHSVISKENLDDINKASQKKFKCCIYTMGGSMKNTSERLFERLKIKTGKNGIIQYQMGEEDSRYHNIGQINGINHGVDPSKPEVYKNIGAQEKIISGEANIVFMWDPDGDRFNIVTLAPAPKGKEFEEYGLKVDYIKNNKNCLVYFTPNQIYFMLTAFQIDSMKRSGAFKKYNWFIATTVPSTHTLEELAIKEGISIIHQQVGFKHWGTFVEWFDKNKYKQSTYTTLIGEKVKFNKDSRVIIMCEESGGATIGGTEFIKNKSGSKEIIGLCEKDGFQIGLITLSLASKLFIEEVSFAEHYVKTLKEYDIKNIYYKRHDRRLYDESLMGEELNKDKEKGIEIRDKIMDFFRNLALENKKRKDLGKIVNLLNEKIYEGTIPLPKLESISLIGNGTLLEGIYFVFENFWFVIRGSGTDALLRYYVEGESKDKVEKYIETLVNLKI